MSESQPTTFLTEDAPQSFSIEGDGRKFFLDEGEALSDSEEGEAFGGYINLVGGDGQAQRFLGRIIDKGDHWMVENYGPKGDPKYKIPKAGVVPEAGQIAVEGIVPAADIPVGLEDAATVVAMEAVGNDQREEMAKEALRQVGVEVGRVTFGKRGSAEAVAEPQPEAPAEPIAKTTAGLPLPAEPEPAAAEEPAAAVQPSAPEPAAEVVPEPAVAEELPAPAPEPAAAPAGAPEKSSKENRHPLIAELQQKMQGVSRPFQAARLWKQAEIARAKVKETGSGKKIGELLAEEGKLKRQAEELHLGIDKMTEAERAELSRESVPLSAEGAAEAVRISNPRYREDMAVFYDAELQKWENVLRNPADFEQYRTLAAEIETKKNEARKLFPGENDAKLLNRAIAQIDQTGSGQLNELGAKLPQRLLEVAGLIHSEPPTLGQAESDVDLRLAYNRAAQQLYAELAGAQPQAAAETVTAPMPEPEPMPEQVSPEQVTVPVEETAAEQTVEGSVEPAAGAKEIPQTETEEVPAAMEESPTEVVLPSTPEEEVTLEPLEEPVETAVSGQGQVVDDAVEQARVEGMPVETALEPEPEPGSDAEALDWLEPPAAAPMPEEPDSGTPVVVKAETLVQPEVELTPDQVRERAERRKNNFAGAVANLEGAYMDTSGTKEERVGKVVEGVRGMILAGLELAEEGGAAQEVVMNVLGRLNNEQNRPLVQAAAGQAPEKFERAMGEMLQARGAFGPDGKPKSRKELADAGLVGLIELLLELGMSFTDASVNAVITEVQSATGAGR